MAQTAVIGFPRWTGMAAFASVGASAAGYPAANLGSLPLSRVWRSASTAPADCEVGFVLSAERPVRLLALCRHNGSRTAEFRVRLFGDAGMTLLRHDTGWQPVWPVVYPLDSLSWWDGGLWDGVYTPEELADTVWHRPVWLPDAYLTRAGTLSLRDPANAAGYLELGMLDIAQGWQVNTGFEFGADYGFKARSTVVEAPGGARYFTRRRKPRLWRGVFRYLDRDQALARGFELLRRADLIEPFLWLPRPDDPQHWLRECWLGRLSDLALMTSALVGHDHFPLSLEEVLE
ncbi:MAG: hypothetical protein OHK0024_21310 [Thalassobaculales bacterium]